MPRIFYLRFIVRNLGRHPLRIGLTVAGIVVAGLAFGILRTVVDTWYAGAEATSAKRLKPDYVSSQVRCRCRGRTACYRHYRQPSRKSNPQAVAHSFDACPGLRYA